MEEVRVEILHRINKQDLTTFLKSSLPILLAALTGDFKKVFFGTKTMYNIIKYKTETSFSGVASRPKRVITVYVIKGSTDEFSNVMGVVGIDFKKIKVLPMEEGLTPVEVHPADWNGDYENVMEYLDSIKIYGYKDREGITVASGGLNPQMLTSLMRGEK